MKIINEDTLPLFTIECFKGKLEFDGDVLSVILKLIDTAERCHPDKNHVEYDLFKLPEDGGDPLITSIMSTIMDRVRDETGCTCTTSKHWVSVTSPNESMQPHVHGSDEAGARSLTATYWVDVPENSGDFYYYPTARLEGVMGYYPSKSGDFIVYPSGLIHGITKNRSEYKRYSLSFEINIDR